MATIPKSEYLGFSADDKNRTYRLRVRVAEGEEKLYRITISNRAFLEHRIGYQDGPAICFMKLEKALLASGDGWPSTALRVTGEELADFRDRNTRSKSSLRPHPEVKP